MEIKKTTLGQLERAYATCIMDLNDEMHYIIASEGATECRSIHAGALEETVIWDQPGGTMNIIPIPGRKNEFIATQKFLPTFNSAECEIVHAKLDKANGWTITPIMKIPYLHRFDLLMIEDEMVLVGGMLCKSKAFKEDWSDPGKIVVGKFHQDITKPFELKTVYDGITKNHGFFAGIWEGRKAFLITGVEGLFVVYPPKKADGEWIVEQAMSHEISDCALCDIDGDGEQELATIEGFHGDFGRIYKKIDNEWRLIHERKFEFGHVVWGGKIADQPSFIIGGRKGDMELVLFTFEQGQFVERVIDNSGGPSNIAVTHLNDRDIIFAANRQVGEYAIYEMIK